MGLLVVHHSRTGSTAALLDAILSGIADAGVTPEVLHAFDAGPEDVLAAGALILATPANFGYMSGALKDFFERIYHPCLDATAGLPYALVVKGDTDTTGAVASIERIVAGLRWRLVQPALTVTGEIRPEDLEACTELGGAMGAGLDLGIF